MVNRNSTGRKYRLMVEKRLRSVAFYHSFLPYSLVKEVNYQKAYSLLVLSD